ncbi:MAG: hypothetical protein RIB65_19050 [Ilumatobacter fluminis]|uniref:hypothetical protein n=1 Tax=Ilumatobacter fluminis TaxID=467091 RepID=UPI0032EF1EAD
MDTEPLSPPLVVDEPTELADAPTRRRGWRVPDRAWIVMAASVVTAVRWWEAADRRVFHVAPDEPGQLAMARWLSGGTRWNMFDHLTWRPGYALTLAPLARIVDGGEGLVRAALTLNAVFAGLSCVLLTLLVRRWTDLGHRATAGIAAVVALAPSAIASSAYTWAESLITLVFLATLVALQRFIDHRGSAAAVAAVALSAFAMTVHGRSLPMLPVTAAVIGVVLIVDRRWREAVAIGGLAATLGLLSVRFTNWVLRNVWDEPSDANTAEAVIERLDAPGALLDSFIGQMWYQLVASLGMVGIGTVVLVAALVRPTGRLGRLDAAVVLVLIAPLAATSVTFMAGRGRPDQLVYGRYVDAVIWPVAALGLAWSWRRLRATTEHRRSLVPVGVALVTIASGIVVAFRHGDQLAGDVGLRMMVPGLLPYIGNGDGVPVLTITALATMAIGVLACVSVAPSMRRLPRSVLLLGAVAAVAFGGVRVHDAQAAHLNSWAIGDDVAEIDRIVPAGEPIGVVMRPSALVPDLVEQRQRFQVYQLFLDDREFVWERRPGRYSTNYVLAPSRVRALVEAGGEVVWYDPGKPMALWQLP